MKSHIAVWIAAWLTLSAFAESANSAMCSRHSRFGYSMGASIVTSACPMLQGKRRLKTGSGPVRRIPLGAVSGQPAESE